MRDVDGWRASVILPCFNSERTVAAAMESALAQTLEGVEVVAVDDGSTDRTVEILQRYVARDPERVRVIEQPHSNPYAARNRGAREARGCYLAFLDSDDLWEPRKLELQLPLLDQRSQVVLCHTGGRTTGPAGNVLRSFPAQPDYQGHCFKRLLVRNRLATSSVVVPRDLFLEMGGFDEALAARGDWEMWTRIARRGEFTAVDLPLIRYRFHGGRMSRDTDRMRDYHLRVIQKHADLYHDEVPGLDRYLRNARFEAHVAYAQEYLGAGRRGRALAEVARALREKPGAAPAWKVLAKVAAGAHGVPGLRAPRKDPPMGAAPSGSQ